MSAPVIENKRQLAALTFGALGIVFGDIGTSPLYAFRECFGSAHGLAISESNVLGILSLIIWSLLLVVCGKYLTLMMRADNRGEGGDLALLALAHPRSHRGVEASLIIALGLGGAGLLFGDGIITPAISVLSAVEGIAVVAPTLEPLAVPLTLIILMVLFSVQRKGTGDLGRVFGGVILTWFLTLAALGVYRVSEYPGVIASLNPWYAISFFVDHGWSGFYILSSVFLAITGCEALYADMGHFGKSPIRWGWFVVVLPALVLNYFGQGAHLLKEPADAANLFFAMAPQGWVIPLIAISTCATIIASQAVLTGVFSLVSQAVQLGYFPRITISHTSEDARGQIYIGLINKVLAVLTIWLVLSYRSSSALASAYGIAVCSAMTCSAALLYFVMRDVWHWSAWRRWTVYCLMGIVDFSFLGANATKILDGGWFPLAIGAVSFLIMTTWYRGRQLVRSRLTSGLLPVEQFVKDLREFSVSRVPGTAVFLSQNVDGVPPAMRHYLQHAKSMHEQVILMAVKIEEEAYLEDFDRVQVESLGSGVFRVIGHVGFMERADAPAILARAVELMPEISLADVSYFVGRESVFATELPGMALWREELFAFMSRNAERAAEFLNLPRSKVVEVGIQVEI